MNEITELIREIEQGERARADELLPLIYNELRRLARVRLANEGPGQTLQATALVHEAYLRLLGPDPSSGDSPKSWDGRGHFFAAAAEAMRRILIENARRKNRDKHGGGLQRIELSENVIDNPNSSEELLQLNDAIEKLAASKPQHAELVKLKLFTGLSTEGAGHALGIPRASAHRHWNYCRAWLIAELK